jgi:multisubunit Na+/H+ antiporter MnhB subunit
VDEAYLSRAQAERSANNVVTAIVFDYRGFDTLGEGAVLFAAISAVSALFRGGDH